MAGQLYASSADVLADAVTALQAGTTTVPDRRGVTVGMIADDQCEQLMVSMLGTWPTDAFPAPADQAAQGNCPSSFLGADFVLRLSRCAPGPSDRGEPPAPYLLDAVAQAVMADSLTLMHALACTLASQVQANTILDYVINRQAVIGPDGGQVVVEIPYKVETLPT